jgi:hypothetical protein
METLLTRLKPEFQERLNLLELTRKELIENILSSERYFSELKLKDACDLALHLNLSSISDVLNIFNNKNN